MYTSIEIAGLTALPKTENGPVSWVNAYVG